MNCRNLSYQVQIVDTETGETKPIDPRYVTPSEMDLTQDYDVYEGLIFFDKKTKKVKFIGTVDDKEPVINSLVSDADIESIKKELKESCKIDSSVEFETMKCKNAEIEDLKIVKDGEIKRPFTGDFTIMTGKQSKKFFFEKGILMEIV